MKTTFSGKRPVATFPGLYDNGDGLVVLAINKNTGIVVQSDKYGLHPINEVSCYWTNFDDTRVWTPIHGKVEFEF